MSRQEVRAVVLIQKTWRGLLGRQAFAKELLQRERTKRKGPKRSVKPTANPIRVKDAGDDDVVVVQAVRKQPSKTASVSNAPTVIRSSSQAIPSSSSSPKSTFAPIQSSEVDLVSRMQLSGIVEVDEDVVRDSLNGTSRTHVPTQSLRNSSRSNIIRNSIYGEQDEWGTLRDSLDVRNSSVNQPKSTSTNTKNTIYIEPPDVFTPRFHETFEEIGEDDTEERLEDSLEYQRLMRSSDVDLHDSFNVPSKKTKHNAVSKPQNNIPPLSKPSAVAVPVHNPLSPPPKAQMMQIDQITRTPNHVDNIITAIPSSSSASPASASNSNTTSATHNRSTKPPANSSINASSGSRIPVRSANTQTQATRAPSYTPSSIPSSSPSSTYAVPSSTQSSLKDVLINSTHGETDEGHGDIPRKKGPLSVRDLLQFVSADDVRPINARTSYSQAGASATDMVGVEVLVAPGFFSRPTPQSQPQQEQVQTLSPQRSSLDNVNRALMGLPPQHPLEQPLNSDRHADRGCNNSDNSIPYEQDNVNIRTQYQHQQQQSLQPQQRQHKHNNSKLQQQPPAKSYAHMHALSDEDVSEEVSVLTEPSTALPSTFLARPQRPLSNIQNNNRSNATNTSNNSNNQMNYGIGMRAPPQQRQRRISFQDQTEVAFDGLGEAEDDAGADHARLVAAASNLRPAQTDRLQPPASTSSLNPSYLQQHVNSNSVINNQQPSQPPIMQAPPLQQQAVYQQHQYGAPHRNSRTTNSNNMNNKANNGALPPLSHRPQPPQQQPQQQPPKKLLSTPTSSSSKAQNNGNVNSTTNSNAQTKMSVELERQLLRDIALLDQKQQQLQEARATFNQQQSKQPHLQPSMQSHSRAAAGGGGEVSMGHKSTPKEDKKEASKEVSKEMQLKDKEKKAFGWGARDFKSNQQQSQIQQQSLAEDVSVKRGKRGSVSVVVDMPAQDIVQQWKAAAKGDAYAAVPQPQDQGQGQGYEASYSYKQDHKQMQQMPLPGNGYLSEFQKKQQQQQQQQRSLSAQRSRRVVDNSDSQSYHSAGSNSHHRPKRHSIETSSLPPLVPFPQPGGAEGGGVHVPYQHPLAANRRVSSRHSTRSAPS